MLLVLLIAVVSVFMLLLLCTGCTPATTVFGHAGVVAVAVGVVIAAFIVAVAIVLWFSLLSAVTVAWDCYIVFWVLVLFVFGCAVDVVDAVTVSVTTVAVAVPVGAVDVAVVVNTTEPTAIITQSTVTSPTWYFATPTSYKQINTL